MSHKSRQAERRALRKRIAEMDAEYDAAPSGSLLRTWLSEDRGRAYAELQALEERADPDDI